MKRKLISFVMFLLVALCVGGCGLDGGVSVKETVPIDIRVLFERTEYTKEDDIKFKVEYEFKDQISKSAKIELEIEGPVKIAGSLEYEFNDVEAIEDKTIEIAFAKPFDVNGEGKVWFKMTSFDEEGNLLYQRGVGADYYITDEEILLGQLGTYELREKHIDHLLERGKIDRMRHKQMLEELSREGSILKTTIKYGGEK